MLFATPFISASPPKTLLEDIAENMGIRADIQYEGRKTLRKAYEPNKPHQIYKVRLFPITDTYRSWSVPRSDRATRRINAVCWHGHREFMHRYLAEFQNATIRTALADYQGAIGFLQNHVSTLRNYERRHTCACRGGLHDPAVGFAGTA